LREAPDLAGDRSPDLLALDEALDRLAAVDSRKATIVEMRFFAGFSIEETASHLGVSAETVGREWRRTKAWLRNELERGSLTRAARQ
jgi:RNA polymerase sigma factor (sigma-70 family)